MFGATVLAPILMGFDPNLAVFFSGIGTLLFMFVVKGKIPSYLGSSFAFIGPVIAATAYGGIPAALGGIVVAGLIYAVVGLLTKTKLGTKTVMTLMPPQVTAAVICIIGIGLAPTAWSNASQNWTLALITLCAAILVAVATRGFPKLIPVLIAVIVGYVSAIFMGKVNFSAINSAAWIGMPHFVLATFKPQAIFLIAPVVIMLIAENIGHVKAISAYMGRNLDDKVGDAFMGDGLSTMLSGFFGGTGQTTYAENIGVMSITKIYSIYPLRVAAIFAILLGLIPKFGALVQSIPAPVMGGITLVLFGMIAGAGASVIAASSKEKTNWSIIESFGVFGVSIAVCAALIATFTANGAINAALPHAPALPTTLKFGFVQLDAIGGSTFFAVILNFAIVVAKKYSPFSDK
jgi:uracil-xanthine permease